MSVIYSGEDDFLNLAALAIHNHGAQNDKATRIAFRLLTEYYEANNAAFHPNSLKPLSFRDTPMKNAIVQLEGIERRTEEQDTQLTILKEAVTFEEQLVSGQKLVPVVPDIHHWDFTKDTPDSDYTFEGPKNRPLIEAWKELRFAGILSNPTDPTKPEFGADFVLDPARLARQAHVIAGATRLSETRLLQTAFVNAAQVMGRRIVHDTPVGQLPPSHWVAFASTTKRALEML